MSVFLAVVIFASIVVLGAFGLAFAIFFDPIKGLILFTVFSLVSGFFYLEDKL